MLRFLPGILIIQVATLALAFASLESDFSNNTLLALGGLSLLFAFFAALWFASIARDIHYSDMDRVNRNHAKEREKIKVSAEKQKAKIIADSQREIERKTARAHARANFRAGAAFAIVIGAGALLIVTQFITAGLLILAGGGGAVLGYAARARHEVRARIKAMPGELLRKQQQADEEKGPELDEELLKISQEAGTTPVKAD